MTKFFLSVLLAGLMVLCFSQKISSNDPASLRNKFIGAEQIYRRAATVSLSADDKKTQDWANRLYNDALTGYLQLLKPAKEAGYDSLLFFCHLRIAYTYYYFDSLDAAKKEYLSAIAVKQHLPAIADSFLFKPYLFTGSIHFSHNEFDSALAFYKKAEQVNDHYPAPLEETPRLYNRLGVMYYQGGNYRQAKNYFEKAISLLTPGNPEENELLVNYKINIGSLLIKLEEYTAAKDVYESILPNDNFNNEIHHNLGIIALSLGDPAKAIEHFRKVKYDQDKKSIDLFYNFTKAFAAMNEPDSARFYIDEAIRENQRRNGTKKNVSYGLLLKYQGDELAGSHRYYEAIDKYQEAILQFDPEFNNRDIYKNPTGYSGAISFINLFHALTSKADAFEKIQKDKNIKALEASLNAYRSAFLLADFVERTYESDEARLFLNKIKYTVHSKPISVSLELFELTQQRHYLEEAYLFDQQNKASILSLNVQENELRSSTTLPAKLLSDEAALKSAITRLSLQAVQATDSVSQQRINESLRDQEIELGKVQEKINADPAWENKRATERIPSTAELQLRLDDHTAILSFHLSANELLTLVITAKEFTYHRQAVGNDFFATLDSLKFSLYGIHTGQRYNPAMAMAMYRQLITPVRTHLSATERLIIIPDDELSYLPFEALQSDNKKYLLEEFAVQYQYSTALLGKQTRFPDNKKTLAFAPFTIHNYVDTSGYQFNSLPASKEEISGLKGAVFMDSAATKTTFLSSANHYSVLHLATHASADNRQPARSFIAFYPGKAGKDFKLYAPEIYDLKLGATQLVILSACETASGQLIKGEGMMSLSRAFAYAGCPNIIASLWKAEDKTTAFITQHLHTYLEQGYTKDRALQKARIDLLRSGEIEPRFKTPEHWAHLVFIGQYERSTSSVKWLLIAALMAIAVTILLLAIRGRYFY